jgi:hypothetical protein
VAQDVGLEFIPQYHKNKQKTSLFSDKEERRKGTWTVKKRQDRRNKAPPRVTSSGAELSQSG